jgi:hypothetical protein
MDLLDRLSVEHPTGSPDVKRRVCDAPEARVADLCRPTCGWCRDRLDPCRQANVTVFDPLSGPRAVGVHPGRCRRELEEFVRRDICGCTAC